jgi:hypothetical protein
MEQLALASFLQNGHAFHLYTYDEVAGVPKGVILKDAAEIIPASRIFKYKDHDSYAGFANLFRYKLLLEKGGYWVDADMVCLKPFPLRPDYVFASELVQKLAHAMWKRPYQIASCLIRTPIGSEIMNYCYSEAAKSDPTKLRWGETGPHLMTTAVQKFGMQPYVTPSYAFCPVNPWQWTQLISSLARGNSGMRTIAKYSPYAVHLWHERWRRQKIDKNATFSPNSIYEQLKRRYLQEVNVG